MWYGATGACWPLWLWGMPFTWSLNLGKKRIETDLANPPCSFNGWLRSALSDLSGLEWVLKCSRSFTSSFESHQQLKLIYSTTSTSWYALHDSVLAHEVRNTTNVSTPKNTTMACWRRIWLIFWEYMVASLLRSKQRLDIKLSTSESNYLRTPFTHRSFIPCFSERNHYWSWRLSLIHISEPTRPY